MTTIPNFSTWKHYKHKNPASLPGGVVVSGLEADFYEQTIDDRLWSCGVFRFHNLITHIAWGVKSDEHCSSHAVMMKNGEWSLPQIGCPNVTLSADSLCFTLNNGSTITY